MYINLDPANSAAPKNYFVTSPNYPSKYPNNQYCQWTFTNVDGGKIKAQIKDFNIESTNNCKKNDYLFFKEIKKYTKIWICGSSVPNKYKTLTSTGDTLEIRFESDDSGRKTGFEVKVIAQ